MFRRLARRAISGTAYESPHWMRVREDQRVGQFIASLEPSGLTAAEVSGGGAGFAWASYTELHYPEFDLLNPSPVGQFDVVLCRHVLEHVADPIRAARTLHDLVIPGGHVIVTVPFMVKVHRDPQDYWRFTRDGLEALLRHVGLDVIETGSWGNAWAVALNSRIWVADRPIFRRFGMHDNPATPLSVWAFARRDQ